MLLQLIYGAGLLSTNMDRCFGLGQLCNDDDDNDDNGVQNAAIVTDQVCTTSTSTKCVLQRSGWLGRFITIQELQYNR